MKKTLSAILALLMLLSLVTVFASCGKTENDNTDTAAVAQTTAAAEETTEPEYVPDDIPDSLKFPDGTVFNVLCDDQQFQYSFLEDEGDGGLLDSAIFSRQVGIEERLNMKFSFIRKAGAYDGAANFTNAVIAASRSGNHDYDLVLAYNMTPAMMANKGLLYDLNDSSSYVNFDKPWWGKGAYQSIAVNDKVYFMTDNASYNTIKNMLAVYINIDLASAYNIDVNTLYKLVDEGKWTMEQMFTMVADVYEDTDKVDGKTAGDTYGLCSGNGVWNEGWYYAAGFITTKVKSADEYEFTLSSQETVDFLDWFNSKFHNLQGVYKSDPSQYQMFKENRAMFYLSAIAITRQDINFEYSAIPMPKYNEDQQSYCTHFSNTYDVWAVPNDAVDPAMSTAVLEALASGAYRTVCPAYYEQYLKLRKSVDSDASRMYDIIRESIVFDFGNMYGLCFSNQNTNLQVRRYINNGDQGWTSTWKAYETQYKKDIEKLLDKIS